MRPKIWSLELFGMITLRHLYFGGAYFAGLVTFMRNLKDIFYGWKLNYNTARYPLLDGNIVLSWF